MYPSRRSRLPGQRECAVAKECAHRKRDQPRNELVLEQCDHTGDQPDDCENCSEDHMSVFHVDTPFSVDVDSDDVAPDWNKSAA